MRTHLVPQQTQESRKRQRIFSSFLATLGYILSPLSWWNDLFVNVPLSYVFAAPFAFIDHRLFLPAFILGYWLSNLLGFVLLHSGVSGLISRQRKPIKLRRSLMLALIYSVIIVLFVKLHWIPLPEELLQKLK